MKSKYSQYFIQIALVAWCILGSVSARAATVATDVSKDLVAISAGERERDEAAKRLRAKPIGEVVSALRAQLAAPSSQVFGLRALHELGESYRTAEIQKSLELLAKKSSSYEVFDALNTSLGAKNKSLAKLYSSKLTALAGKKKNSPLKSSLLAGLSEMGEPLTDSLFAKLLADDDYTVRESTIRQFLATREKISQSVQASRFRQMLKAQPFQARVVAMEAFANLPLPELKALAQAFDDSQCKSEKFEETRAACEKIRESLKKAGAP